MDNRGILSPVATMIMEDETTLYEFNETQVDGNARVLFYHPTDTFVTVVVHKFYGDRTGQVHLRQNQIVYVEYVESESNVTEAPVSYIIDYGAEIVMPTEVHFQGTNTTLNGMLIGVHHLYVEDNCNLIVTSTAQTAQLQNEHKVDTSAEGNFELPTINVKRDGILEFSKITTDFTIGAAFLEMKYGSKILMNHGFIVAGDVDMETSSRFSLEGKGHGAETGDGKGLGSNGGSYGGVGGGADDLSSYGSVFDPYHLGSGGSGTDGGSGGGFVNFTIGKSFHIDGYVDAYGTAGTGNGGGGSGGSIFIKAYNMSGRGVLDVSGGDGSGSGCGGSGGRIAAHIDRQNLFVGKYLSHGGYSGNNLAQCIGGPGTIYKYESARGPQYRELKYNPRLNETIIEPEHRKITIENGEHMTSNPAVVMETDSDFYEFEELQVEGYSYVHFYHPVSAQTVTVIIHELTGNRKGMIRVQSAQQVVINFVEATHTYLDAPCGFHVDPDGEIVLPSTVVILTEQTILGGAMIGVEELFIERDAEFIMDNNACTDSLENFETGATGSRNTGILNIPAIAVNNLGIFTVDMNPIHPTIKSGYFTVRNGGLLAANSFQITMETAYLDVEYGGSIDGSEQGYPAEDGPGAGSANSYDASGGALASRGIII